MIRVHLYYDRAGNPVDNLTDWLRLRTDDQVTVARTELPGGVLVTSVWLGFNLAAEGPPLIFQTNVSGGPYHDTTWRYPTEAATLTWHERIVTALQEGREP